MKTVCKLNECAGCMACVNICIKKSINVKDEVKVYNAVIDEDKCIECGMCYKICPQNIGVELRKQQEWYQGWADKKTREQGASGGVASSISNAFIKNGGVVCSCVLENGEFIYKIAETEKEALAFAGSKYVKSNPQEVYKNIKYFLQQKRKVLFIGLPCHVAGVKKYIGNELGKSLFTIDFICHGTPSPKVLEYFLNGYGLSLKEIQNLQFRKKTVFNMYINDKIVAYPGTRDFYTIGFLEGLFYTENCYNCPYAQTKRIGDVTLGDSWGSELSQEDYLKGISLILCQTEKGKEILKQSKIHFENVDLKKAIAANHQLKHPSPKARNREIFFDLLEKGIDFQKIMAKCCLKKYIKQKIKRVLFYLKPCKNKSDNFPIGSS